MIVPAVLYTLFVAVLLAITAVTMTFTTLMVVLSVLMGVVVLGLWWSAWDDWRFRRKVREDLCWWDRYSRPNDREEKR